MNKLLPIKDGEDKSCPFKNCLRNNYRHLRKWAKKTDTDAFRIYDRHLHHYPFAIDYYAGRFCIHYFARHRLQPEPDKELIEELEQILFSLFGIAPQDIFWRIRKRRTRFEQYEKAQEDKDFFSVKEHGAAFLVNLKDYLDTGLFLDHRQTRQIAASEARGKKLLNLFSYTAAFSIHGALQGACTTTVDMSNTYLAWAKKNFLLNEIDLNNHSFVRADCFKFLEEAIRNGLCFDVIVIDPPTISRSKKMTHMFSIQLDYPILISSALQLLSPEGVIFFSTNSRKFRFDKTLFEGVAIEEITQKTLPIDFLDPNIHKVWKIYQKSAK